MRGCLDAKVLPWVAPTLSSSCQPFPFLSVLAVLLGGLLAGVECHALEAYRLDGFPGELSPKALSSGATPLDKEGPTDSALRGMNDGIVLALRAGHDPEQMSLRAAQVVPRQGKAYLPECTASSEKPIGCEILVVSHTKRSLGPPGYLRTLVDRCPSLQQGQWADIPEVLVYDLDGFISKRDGYASGGEVPLGEGDVARAGVAADGEVRYFLLRYRVAMDAPADEYQIVLDAGPAGADLSVRIVVLGTALPPGSKYLCLSAEFDEQHHLRALADAGLTFMRTRGSDRWSGRDARFRELASLGVRALSQELPPQSRRAVSSLPKSPVLYYYGVDEPQPKPGVPGHEGWDRMAEHIKRSNRIHEMGGKVGVSLPFQLAESLVDPNGGVYETTTALGTKGMYEPLDWASYDSGLPRMLNPSDRRTTTIPGIRATADLDAYLEARRTGRERKRDRLETCYFPLGLMRDPFFARYMFGVFTGESGLDGVMGWTSMRAQGKIFDDADGVDALVALPTSTGLATTYAFEAMRAGINDLRIIELLRSRNDEELNVLLALWRSIIVGGKRIDMLRGEAGLADLRRELMNRVRLHCGKQ